MNTPEFWADEIGANAQKSDFSHDVSTESLFSEIYALKQNIGGKRLSASDLNNFLKVLSENTFYFQHGGTWEYHRGFTYPKNAMVVYDNAIFICLEENSTYPYSEAWKKVFDIAETPAEIKQRLEQLITDAETEFRNSISETVSDYTAKFESVNGDIETVRANHEDLALRVSANEEHLSATDAGIQTLQDQDTQHDTRLNALDNALSSVQAKNTDQDSKITALQRTTADHETRITSNANRIQAVTAYASDNTARIQVLEGDLSTAKADIVNNASAISALSEDTKAERDRIEAKFDGITTEIINNTYTKTEIDTKLSNVYTYKGSVQAVANLPVNAALGDVYDVKELGMNYAWDGVSWDSLGTIVNPQRIDDDLQDIRLDLSGIHDSITGLTDTDSTLDAKIDTEVSTLNTKIDTEVQALTTADTTLDAKIDSVEDTLSTGLASEVQTLNSRITSEIATLRAYIDEQISNLDTALKAYANDLDSAVKAKITKLHQAKTVTVEPESATVVTFDIEDYFNADVRVLVQDPETDNLFINSEGAVTLAYTSNGYKVINETAEALTVMLILN